MSFSGLAFNMKNCLCHLIFLYIVLPNNNNNSNKAELSTINKKKEGGNIFAELEINNILGGRAVGFSGREKRLISSSFSWKNSILPSDKKRFMQKLFM
jgi:hypothetical protein